MRRLLYLSILVAAAAIFAKFVSLQPSHYWTSSYDNVLPSGDLRTIGEFAFRQEGVVTLENGVFMPSVNGVWLKVYGFCGVKLPVEWLEIRIVQGNTIEDTHKVFMGVAQSASFAVVIPSEPFVLEVMQVSTFTTRGLCNVTVEAVK